MGDTAEKCTLNARLDYVLYRVNQPASKPDLGTWRLVESSVVHSDNIVSYKGKQYPLSDHYGVCSLFTSHPCDPSVGLPRTRTNSAARRSCCSMCGRCFLQGLKSASSSESVTAASLCSCCFYVGPSCGGRLNPSACTMSLKGLAAPASRAAQL